ncbi:MAG: hypothetical protein LBG66_04000 [Gallionellaceae bacterium]|nr:hypothetical protein [Gallionellaceae bacterium]
MSNHAWVCFACRNAVRREGTASDVRCPDCGQQCEHLGYKTPVPPKSKVKEWEELRLAYYASRQERFTAQEQARVRRRHEIEKEIAKLESLPANQGRVVAIKLLRKQIENAH